MTTLSYTRNAPQATWLRDGAHLEAIEQSHQRCSAIGLSRLQAPDFARLARADLSLARERQRRLLLHAAPVMEMLYEQVVNTQSMVLLTDACGTVIHTIGDDDFLTRANKVALQPGVDWSEAAKGTNAIGTALIAERPTLVHAEEHYLHANGFLSCSAVPIHDPRGNVLGVIDVSGDQRLHHQHTMGLVKMSARMIENHWLHEDFRHVMRLQLHVRAEFIGTLMEGIVAVGRDGRILGANRGALDQLGLSGAAARMHSTTSLFGIAVGALVDHFRSPLAAPLALHLPDGRPVHLRAQFSWPAGVAAGDAEEPAAPAPSIQPPAAPRVRQGGLRALDTGDSAVREVIAKLRKVLNRPIPILIGGETGTGKELLARAIHEDSQRAARPFVAVNCASIPETLIEAELFGYDEGAFTGARRKGAVGKIAHADGGTLFLDEIGDMPLALQARLLRVLQERQVTPLGSHKAQPVDIALISASHRDLRGMVRAQQFREDLYWRLNGVALKLPPLRERSDLAVLVRKILAAAGAPPALGVDAEAMQRLAACRWPGNLRQLHSVLQTALALAAGEAAIGAEHLGEELSDATEDASASIVVAEAAAPDAAPPARTLEEAETEMIRRAVEAAGGNISAASKQLGIARNTIYRRLRWSVGA